MPCPPSQETGWSPRFPNSSRRVWRLQGSLGKCRFLPLPRRRLSSRRPTHRPQGTPLYPRPGRYPIPFRIHRACRFRAGARPQGNKLVHRSKRWRADRASQTQWWLGRFRRKSPNQGCQADTCQRRAEGSGRNRIDEFLSAVLSRRSFVQSADPPETVLSRNDQVR
jgi:hypothetical protein